MLELSQTDLAEALAITTRQIRNLEKEGMPHRAEGNRKFYPLAEAIPWYIERKMEEAARNATPSQLDAAKLQKAQADADRAQMDMEVRRGTLVPLDWMEEQFADACSTIRAAIQTVPSRHGSTVRADDPDAGTASLEVVVDELLERLTDAFTLEDDEDAAA